MNIVKPLLIASALVLSSASFARDPGAVTATYDCHPGSKVVNGLTIYLTSSCDVKANTLLCGNYPGMTLVQIKSIIVKNKTCTIVK